MKILEGLNKEQLEAVITIDGQIIVIAGAGSGKTRVLTRRISYLVENGIVPDNILALTFTNKAAKEMKERVAKLVNSGDLWISTFHSMCVRILRRFINLVGYQNNFNIIDSEDQNVIVKKIIKEKALNLKFKPREIINYFGKLRVGGVNNLFSQDKEDLEYVYQLYKEYLFKNNLLDFDDLIYKTVQLFEENKDVLEYYQEKFHYILVDEYQDTNDIQNKLISLISQKHQNIFLVGDIDQSIYKFRGANYKNLLEVEKKYPNSKVIKLEQNYRSTANILNAANMLIKNNKSQYEKKLWTSRGDGDKIVYFRAITDSDESEFIAEEITDLIDSGVASKEICILYRSNYLTRNIESALNRYQIQYIVYGGVGYYKRKEVKDIISYLKVIVDEDNYSLQRVINEPKRGIGPSTLEKINNHAIEDNLMLIDVCSNAKDYFSKNLAEKLSNFALMIKQLKEAINELELDQFLDLVFEKTDYLEHLKLLENGDIKIENIKELKTLLKNHYINKRDDLENLDKLKFILSEISLETDKEVDVRNSIRLMTIHNSKGLEFENVFIYGLEEGIFPTSRVETEEDVEEERRLAYVAITRAKKKLYLTNCCIRSMYGSSTSNEISRFLEEIEDELLIFKGNRKNRKEPIFELKNKRKKVSNNIYSVGDKVRHTIFGDGIVINTSAEIVSIAFKVPHGIKKLLSNHQTLSKIN